MRRIKPNRMKVFRLERLGHIFFPRNMTMCAVFLHSVEKYGKKFRYFPVWKKNFWSVGIIKRK